MLHTSNRPGIRNVPDRQTQRCVRFLWGSWRVSRNVKVACDLYGRKVSHCAARSVEVRQTKLTQFVRLELAFSRIPRIDLTSASSRYKQRTLTLSSQWSKWRSFWLVFGKQLFKSPPKHLKNFVGFLSASTELPEYIQLSVYTPWWRREVEVHLHSTITSHQMRWVVKFTLRPLYPQEKSPRYALNRRLAGSQGKFRHFGADRICRACHRFNPKRPVRMAWSLHWPAHSGYNANTGIMS